MKEFPPLLQFVKPLWFNGFRNAFPLAAHFYIFTLLFHVYTATNANFYSYPCMTCWKRFCQSSIILTDFWVHMLTYHFLNVLLSYMCACLSISTVTDCHCRSSTHSVQYFFLHPSAVFVALAQNPPAMALQNKGAVPYVDA